MSYISPIDMITTQMRVTYEEEALKAVHDVGFLVKKEELEKALKYDRDQYAKGFSDGRESAIDELLEVIDELFERMETLEYADLWHEEARNRIQALKGGEHEISN